MKVLPCLGADAVRAQRRWSMAALFLRYMERAMPSSTHSAPVRCMPTSGLGNNINDSAIDAAFRKVVTGHRRTHTHTVSLTCYHFVCLAYLSLQSLLQISSPESAQTQCPQTHTLRIEISADRLPIQTSSQTQLRRIITATTKKKNEFQRTNRGRLTSGK